jgi:serine/threonine protein phosphatase PrpC
MQVFGICDGHGGRQAANHVCRNVYFSISQSNRKLEKNYHNTPKEIIWNALKLTYVALHESFDENDSGTTATISVICDNMLWIANAGDSRAFLNCKDGRFCKMTG